jgi:hypothetical protein
MELFLLYSNSFFSRILVALVHQIMKRVGSESALVVSPKDIALLFFSISKDEIAKDPRGIGNGCKWVCYCGHTRAKTGNGYTNLVTHVQSSHIQYEHIVSMAIRAGWDKTRNTGKKYLEKMEKDIIMDTNSPTTLESFIPRKAINLYEWMDWIISKLLPFSFVECKLTRQYCRLSPISRKTLVKFIRIS